MEDLIEKNMGLIVSIVNSFSPKSDEERDDYIQAGRIGLWKALQKYKPEKGCKFSPYARNPIRWEIIKLINNKDKHNHCLEINESNGHYSMSDNFWEFIPDTLTEEEQDVIRLRCMGYNFSEICKNIGRGRHYTKKLFVNAVNKMRESNE